MRLRPCLPLGKWDPGLVSQARKLLSTGGREGGGGCSVVLGLRPDQALLLSVDFLPTFLKEVCFPPPPAVPPGQSLPDWSWVPVCAGERGGGCASHHRSQLPLDAEKSNFLSNCHRLRALSPHSLLLLGGTSFSLMLPDSCFPLPTPWRTLPPPQAPVSGRTIYHVLSGEGWREQTGPRPGLPDEIVLFRGG